MARKAKEPVRETAHDPDLDPADDVDVEQERENLIADDVPEEEWPAPLRRDRITADAAVELLKTSLKKDEVVGLIDAVHALFAAGIIETPENAVAVRDVKARIYARRRLG
jgi:hypothetical protein